MANQVKENNMNPVDEKLKNSLSSFSKGEGNLDSNELVNKVITLIDTLFDEKKMPEMIEEEEIVDEEMSDEISFVSSIGDGNG